MTKTLDVNLTPETAYCVPLFVRDFNIEHAIKAVSARIDGPSDPETRGDEPVAIACFGPSLNDTWEELRGFSKIMSCSGSHKFLVERGIIPTWHLEVDPRPHKVQLIGPPHKDVEYLIASTCAPEVFAHLQGCNVKLWHVFDNQAEALRVLPPGEWAITGGSSVGLRCLTIARHFGYRNLHVFGMDGCEGASGKHAAPHPKQPQGHYITTYKGVDYKTTPSLLACAKQTFHELNQLYDVNVTFHGEGLVQAMAKDYVREPVPPDKAIIGFAKPELISAEYRDLNVRLHRENSAYGVGGERHAPIVMKLAQTLGTKNVLDYGSGKGRLAQAIPWQIAEYDPAIPGKDTSPKPADLVVCCDVLEHIEPPLLAHVLADLRRCTLRLGYFVVHTGKSTKTLADGRNAHLIQQGEEWWTKKLSHHFHVAPPRKKGPLLYYVVEPRRAKGKAA